MPIQNAEPALVLGSTSPTRARLLRGAGLEFSVSEPLVDEQAVRQSLWAASVPTIDAAIALADIKARSVSSSQSSEALTLAADQLLEFDGQWLEKPSDKEKCREQLRRLRGRQHRLLSGVVAYRGGSRCWQYCGEVDLQMREFSEDFLETYLETVDDSTFNSVGGYQLEGLGSQLMASVKGDYFTVLGLPLLAVLQFLRDHRVIGS